MACFANCLNDWDLTIPQFRNINGITYYFIQVRIGEVSWSVSHRYSHFVDLNNVLSSDHGFSKDLLPPKRYFGRQDEAFLETRRGLLEEYLRRTFILLKAPMPRLLVSFLKIDRFDIFYLLESIHPAMLDFESMVKNKVFIGPCIPTLSILQAHALRKCLKLPWPSSDIYKLKVDCSDVLEICGNLESVCISGCIEYLIDSNLSEQNLEFDLAVFKSLKHLTLYSLNLNQLHDASCLRRNICHVKVENCFLKSPADFIFCDLINIDPPLQSSNKVWTKLTSADWSFNRIESIGFSVGFTPNIKKLNLRNNKLKELNGLNLLEELQYLNVSNNFLSNLTHAGELLTNLTYLDLSGNQITSLAGLQFLSKLTGIDLSFNVIHQCSELKYISKLPLLSSVVLTGNPLSKMVDYRIKVLLEFGDAHRRLLLDNEESSQKELDRVAILLALQSVERLQI